jgi:hypothetical protein
MDETLRSQRDTALAYLDRLTRRGREIAECLKTTPDSAVDIRAWQQDCAAAINELSGGSKAHWLSRAFSQAFLVRPSAGGVVVEASAAEIVDRLLAVLAQASASLASISADGADSADGGAPAEPAPRRFDFVHDAELRPVLEQADVESGRALEAGDVHRAFITACSILEAIITDALVQARHDVAAWSFDQRIATAEREGLIRGGCARLSPAARIYRDLAPDVMISERDAKLARQVLHVVLRDLDPGR